MTKKKRNIIIFIIIVVIIGGYFIFNKKNPGPEYVTVTAETGDVIQTVDATGAVSSTEDITLNFKTTGRITALDVEAGDQVESGQVLARLDAGALNSRVSDARSAVLEAQANLDQVLAGSTAEDIRISEIAVTQKEQALTTAQNNLNSLELKQEVELTNYRNTCLVTLKNEMIIADSALETINKTLNDNDASDTLGIQNIGTLEAAGDSYTEAKKIVSSKKIVVSGINSSSNDEEILSALDEVKAALESIRQALSNTYDVLEATITSQDLTQTELDTLISGIQTKQTSVSTSLTNLQTAESNWTNKQVSYADQIKQYQDAVASAEDALELARAQLDLKRAGPESYDITAAEARVAKARAGLELAVANLNDTVIAAPVAGTITKVNNKIGEQTSLSTAVMTMIGDSNLEIEVNIPESDIVKIDVGQAADITLDAFSDDLVFAGTITFIDPAETVIQDVVYYKVKVQFNEDSNKIKPGMTANVTVHAAEKTNVMRVPIRAVKQKNGDKIVEVLTAGDIVEEKKVTTGLKGDDFIEITSGLKVGEEVITFVKE